MKLFNRQIGEGKTVIILHGLFGFSDNWQTFAKNLASYGYRVILPDLRNHGQSPHDPAFNYRELSEDVHELILNENLDRVLLAGHSLGGKTAMAFTFQHPQFVSKLAVIDIAPRQYPLHHQAILDALFSLDFQVVKTRKDAELRLSEKIHDPGVLQFLLKNLYWAEKDRLAWKFNLDAISRNIAEVGQPTYPETVCHIPTIFIRGEKSGYITESDEMEIHTHFSNTRVLTAPAAGHWVHAENPAWLLKEMVEFFGS